MDAAAAGTGLPQEAYATALAMLPLMGPARLAAVLECWSPERAWDAVRGTDAEREPSVMATLGGRRRAADVTATWRRRAADLDPAAVWTDMRAARVGVAVRGSRAYPVALDADVEPPSVIFHRGDLDRIAGPRVAIVGTRTCSRYGREIAFEFGQRLAEAGVGVVSGLALGIDGAAHAGALAIEGGPPIAVVGSGLDVVYPRSHRELWRKVEAVGVVLSEAPLGAPPEPWRFPARNRLIAALADVLVVVESRERGGSMHSVTEAMRRSVPVLAVPGPVRSPVSAGTNRLLSEGATPACDVGDVLVALGLSPGACRRAAERRTPPEPEDEPVLAAVGWQPRSLDQLAGDTGLDLANLALALRRLEAGGWLAANGSWWERVAR
jgi:DNA processing protein